jgi:hypothetical protein
VALWARIVDGVLISVGDLPLSARRLDTGELLGPGQIEARLAACGFYDVDTVDPAEVTADPVKRVALVADLTAAVSSRSGRQAFVDGIQQAINSLSDTNWDFLDAYTDRSFPGQNGPVGQEWPAPPANPTTAQVLGVLANRIELLRTQVCFMAYAQIREAKAFGLVLEALDRLIDSNPSLIPPSDR